LLDGLPPVLCLSHYGYGGFGIQKGAKPLTNYGVILGEEYTYLAHGVFLRTLLDVALARSSLSALCSIR
jgi:hypothetical protein